jgi:hypothetical protein
MEFLLFISYSIVQIIVSLIGAFIANYVNNIIVFIIVALLCLNGLIFTIYFLSLPEGPMNQTVYKKYKYVSITSSSILLIYSTYKAFTMNKSAPLSNSLSSGGGKRR